MPILKDQPQQEIVRFQKGKTLFREGGPGDYFYVLQEGKVEISKNHKGKELPIAVLGKGQCVGEISALDHQPRSATATALTEVIAVKVDARALQNQMSRNPSWFRTIMTEILARIRDANELLRRNGIVDEKLVTTIRALETMSDASNVPAGSEASQKKEAA